MLPPMPALYRLLCCFALFVGGAALAACSSEEGDSASAAPHASSSRSGGYVDTGRPASVCERVAGPPAKRSTRMPPPTSRLNAARRYVVMLVTNCGTMAVELDVHAAPRTTSSFAYLVKRGFYDGLTFHRVAADYLIQGGDPDGDGTGGPGYTVVEPPPKGLRYTLGSVAMAKSEADPPGTSGSQFFIVTARSTALPPQYALVGRVISGLRILEAIGRLATDPPQDGAPTVPVVIEHAQLSVSR